MDLINRSIQYTLSAETGNTNNVVVGIYGKSDNLEINANLTILADDLTKGTNFDDLSKKQLFALATKKLPALLPNLAYTNYQFFVQNDKPVRLTAYSNLSNDGSYITLNSTIDQSDFKSKAIESVGYEDVKAAVKNIISKELPTPSTEV
ncbi:Uncharacterised protein [Lactiplantibacillus plantarum]|nr:hypothetical protein [Lactiplantibacillus plantarum]VDH09826.1 Uncharacterised protein [Lactiplantibacillus plantarum]